MLALTCHMYMRHTTTGSKQAPSGRNNDLKSSIAGLVLP
jgi:hypothetical protein